MTKRIISLILLITVLSCSTIAFAADVNLSDIDSSHWAYNAIAELVSKGTVNGYPDGTFKPNGIVTYAEFEKMITGVWNPNSTPISREAALDMLWNYNGKPTGYKVPGIITNQMKNGEAAAWGYATGLMQGNDGLNLRPNDTLTRAEASTLIVRASKSAAGNRHFAADISDDVAKLIWDGYRLFDSEYNANDPVTAEEIINAAKKLGNFKKLSFEINTVTVEDAATLLLYGGLTRTRESYAVISTDGVTDKYGTVAQIYAAYAYENGFMLPNSKNTPATKRDVALILLQINDLVGLDDVKINTNMATYPANYKDYAFIQDGIPAAAYSVSYDNGAKPVDYFKFVSGYTYIFENFVNEMETKYAKGAVDFELIPSMVSQNMKTEAILRVRCTVKGTTAYALFGAGYENAGEVFYMDIHTGEPVLNIYIPTDIAKIGKFVCNE